MIRQLLTQFRQSLCGLLFTHFRHHLKILLFSSNSEPRCCVFITAGNHSWPEKNNLLLVKEFSTLGNIATIFLVYKDQNGRFRFVRLPGNDLCHASGNLFFLLTAQLAGNANIYIGHVFLLKKNSLLLSGQGKNTISVFHFEVEQVFMVYPSIILQYIHLFQEHPMHIIVTGGAGYIGSHTCLELLNAGHEVTVIDNLCNARIQGLKRVEELTGKTIRFFQVDLLDEQAVDRVFAQSPDAAAVIHFAGLKAVGESVEKPLLYYTNNLTGTINLCRVMDKYGVKNIVFSSSATVYGDPASVPITEEFPLLPATNPYGRTKAMIEDILRDVYVADPSWNIALLRYFNPVGAHESGRIGEDPNGIPCNLMPYISQVAVGKLKELSVFGGDYPTPDGSGVRDYIHVVDLARGHLKALEKLEQAPGVVTYNLGTGRGYSVLDMVAAFEKASGKKVACAIAPRRAGDIAQCYADPSLAAQELGWKAERDIDAMCRDTWRWQAANPNGYEDK
jgi:UDP-glucose 4-epimerase